jgi:hypothetical protein
MIQFLKKMGVCVGLAGLLSVGGCDLLGVLMDKGSGAETISAQYKLPKDQPILVLVESYENVGDINGDANRIGEKLVKNISDLKLANTVKPSVLDNLQGVDPENYRHMQITEIGRACGAKLVLYMNLQSTEIDAPQGGATARGELMGFVKVVDCSTGETRWPLGMPKGQPVAIQTPWEGNENSVATAKLREQLAENAATLVSQLFYDHPSEHPVDEGPTIQ